MHVNLFCQTPVRFHHIQELTTNRNTSPGKTAKKQALVVHIVGCGLCEGSQQSEICDKR